MAAEKRLRRDEDTPWIETLRVVQSAHTESIQKLTDTQSVMASTIAVHASTLNNLSEIAKANSAALLTQRDDLTSLKAGLRLISWGLPLLIAAIGVAIPTIMFLARLKVQVIP